jgi:3-dehydroquinate synthase
LAERVGASAASVELVVVACDETSKTLRSMEALCQRALASNVDRNALLIAVGGGVCTDLVTFAASVIRRGIDHLRIPTTLIGQVDAAVGVKGAVNYCGKKSFLGVFRSPRAVFVDTLTLETLPEPLISDGLAEIVKIALIRDPDLFELVADDPGTLVDERLQGGGGGEIVTRAIEAMMAELEPNLYEDKTYRRRVDLGHTFSPALEAAHGFRISHGMAVAVDLAFSAAIAVELGLSSQSEFERIVETLRQARLPTCSPLLTRSLCVEALEDARRHRGGAVNLVVPTGIGNVRFVPERQALDPALIAAAIRRVPTPRLTLR